jgi:hypothetical protein
MSSWRLDEAPKLFLEGDELRDNAKLPNEATK